MNRRREVAVKISLRRPRRSRRSSADRGRRTAATTRAPPDSAKNVRVVRSLSTSARSCALHGPAFGQLEERRLELRFRGARPRSATRRRWRPPRPPRASRRSRSARRPRDRPRARAARAPPPAGRPTPRAPRRPAPTRRPARPRASPAAQLAPPDHDDVVDGLGDLSEQVAGDQYRAPCAPPGRAPARAASGFPAGPGRSSARPGSGPPDPPAAPRRSPGARACPASSP